MKNKNILLAAGIGLTSMLAFAPGMAQSLPETNVQMIVTPHNQQIDYHARTLCFDIPANVEYTITSSAPWLTSRIGSDGTVYLHAEMNEVFDTRSATVTFTSNTDSELTKTLTITQGACNAADMLTDHSRVQPVSVTDNTHNGSETADKTIDGDASTLWHSAYSGFNVSESNPAILTYTFEDAEAISSITYVPRSSGSNGNFGKVRVYYMLEGDTEYTQLGEYDFGQSGSASTISMGENPLIHPTSIRFEVLSGYGDFASCAEMEFRDNSKGILSQFNMFADDLCTELKPDVDEAAIDTISNPFIQMMARNIYNNSYSTDYRVAEYPCHLSPQTQSEQWNAPGKLYDQLSGVTGISFKAHTTQAVAVSGIPEGMNVQLKVVAWYVGRVGQNFDGGNPNTSAYTLFNGVNIINYDYDWDGLAYICYYSTDDPANHPDIKVHFMNGQVNGYLSPDKTNEEMHEMCVNAPNSHMDLVGSKVHSVWSSEGLSKYCKASDGTSLGYIQYMNLLDSLVAWEHDLLGLTKYNRLPDNRTMAYVNYTYYMFQGGMGVSFHVDVEPIVLNCYQLMYGGPINGFDKIWGLSHEWGHQHQMSPWFNWAGQGECTNNMNSCYNTLHMGYKGSDASRISDKWTDAYNRFIGQSTSDSEGETATARQLAYTSISDFSWCPEIQDSIRAQQERYQNAAGNYCYPDMATDPDHALSISEANVEEQLAPFFMLYCYFSNPENENGQTVDYQQDIYESLRQITNENGSTVEPEYANGVASPKTAYDKYELLALAQNGNINNAYTLFAERYPESVWNTHQYINADMTYTQNSIPFLLNYIRKASKISGYNLFDFFDRFGFLRTVAMTLDDYGHKSFVLTKQMKDEFKTDMEALGLKEMTDEMIERISHTNIPEFETPNIPNEPTPKQ